MIKVKIWLTILFQMFIILLLSQELVGISCYKCQSRNGMDPSCESASSGAGYQENCRFQPMGRQSQFSGEYCIKVIGKLIPSRETIVIRDCDERPLNRTQISYFNYRGIGINGTQYSCKTDYCNHSINNQPNYQSIIIPITWTLILVNYFQSKR
ncbi:uncharacterized protein LOC128393274 [Panonychus citri]|uniref:uncharacterized protein LOC128393274 n=1 Tax=Panonychus citri TaxID=50023 RepID=UPI002306DDE0|nr:uncharacterized protein LOC128393274 [Panonychus citri]